MHNYDYISKYYKLEFNYENYCNYRVKWLSTRIIKEKIYTYTSLPKWKSKNSHIDDLIKFILDDFKG